MSFPANKKLAERLNYDFHISESGVYSISIAGWNRDWKRVDPDQPFILKDQPAATQQFIHDVFRFRDECRKRGSAFILMISLMGVILASVSGFMVWQKILAGRYAIPYIYVHDAILADQKVDIDNDGKEERLVVLNDDPHSTFGTTKVLFIRKDNSFVKLPDEGDELQWIKTGDFNRNGLMDIAILYGYSGSAGFGHFYLYEWNKGVFKTLLAREDINSEVDFQDMNNDGVKEIIYRFSPLKWSKEEKDIYQWQKEKMAYAKLPRH